MSNSQSLNQIYENCKTKKGASTTRGLLGKYLNNFSYLTQHANNSMYSINHVVCNVKNYSGLTYNEPPWEM